MLTDTDSGRDEHTCAAAQGPRLPVKKRKRDPSPRVNLTIFFLPTPVNEDSHVRSLSVERGCRGQPLGVDPGVRGGRQKGLGGLGSTRAVTWGPDISERGNGQDGLFLLPLRPESSKRENKREHFEDVASKPLV